MPQSLSSTHPRRGLSTCLLPSGPNKQPCLSDRPSRVGAKGDVPIWQHDYNLGAQSGRACPGSSKVPAGRFLFSWKLSGTCAVMCLCVLGDGLQPLS